MVSGKWKVANTSIRLQTAVYTLEQQLGVRIGSPDSVETGAEKLLVVVHRAVGRHRVRHDIPGHNVVTNVYLPGCA